MKTETGMSRRNYLVILLAAAMMLSVVLLPSCKLLGGLTGSSSTDTQSQQASQQNSQNGQDTSEDDQDDSQAAVSGSTQWPGDVMGNLPVPAAVITAVFKDETKKEYVVSFTGMELADAEAYADSFRDLGYANELDLVADDSIMVSGTTSGGAQALFAYSVSEKGGTVTFIHEPEAVVSVVVSADMTDADNWPVGFLEGIPELPGKITYVSYDGETSVNVDLSYVEKVDFDTFLDAVKQAGFTVDADESKSTTGIDYSAYNEAGEWFYTYISYDDAPESGNTVRVEMYKAE